MSSEKVNVLIVEDESIVAMDLAAGLENDGYNVVGMADSADEAIELFTGNDVDIVLMDINIIGDRDGIDTAKELLKIRKIPVIYLTAVTDAASVNRIKDTQPAAFLTKPYNINNVRIAIDLAINNFASATTAESKKDVSSAKSEASSDKDVILQMNQYVFIKQNYRFIKVALADIQYAESENNYIHIITAQRKYTLRMSLQQLEEKIHYNRLIRIHKSYMVNMDAIRSFSESEVQVEGGIDLPIGRNYKDNFIQQFKS
jgi:DNA-binding LytR/AlgR family response regulator